MRCLRRASGAKGHSGSMRADLIMRPHFCASAAWKRARTCGVVVRGSILHFHHRTMRLQSDPAPASRAPATFPRPDAREILATGSGSGSGSAGADFCLAPLLFGNWRGHGGRSGTGGRVGRPQSHVAAARHDGAAGGGDGGALALILAQLLVRRLRWPPPRCRAAKPVVGQRLHLCPDLARLVVRGLRHPAGRGRSKRLPATRLSGHHRGGVTEAKQPPRKPGRFNFFGWPAQRDSNPRPAA